MDIKYLSSPTFLLIRHTHAHTATRRRRIWTKCDKREKMGARETSIYHQFNPLPRALRPASEACGRKNARNYNSHVRKSLSAPFFFFAAHTPLRDGKTGGTWGRATKNTTKCCALLHSLFLHHAHSSPRAKDVETKKMVNASPQKDVYREFPRCHFLFAASPLSPRRRKSGHAQKNRLRELKTDRQTDVRVPRCLRPHPIAPGCKQNE